MRREMTEDDRYENADFEDDRLILNKEARFRMHTLKIFNKPRGDFESDREYNDYLELVEDIIFNLVNEVDIEQTRAKVEQYRRENQDSIGQNQARRTEEDRQAVEILARTERERLATLASLRQRDQEIEDEARRRRQQEELEQVQRVALGEKEASRLKAKQEKRERKESRRLTAANEAVAAARSKAADPDIRPMNFRPAFPNPPPRPTPGVQPAIASDEIDRLARGSAGGFRKDLERSRAHLEFANAIARLAR
jgi:CDK-activating kinase assembly factor MAT1